MSSVWQRAWPATSTRLRQADPVLLVVLLLGALLRFAYWRFSEEWASVEGHLRWPDEQQYKLIADAIGAEGLQFFTSNERAAWVAPGNPLYLWLLGAVRLIKTVNILSSVVVIGLVYAIARRVSPSLVVARSAAVLTAVSPLAIEYTPTVLTEAPFTALLVGWFYALLRAMEPGSSARWWISGGLLLGFACLFRAVPQMLPLGMAIVLLFWSRLSTGNWRSPLVKVLALQAVLVFAVGAPAMIRNKVTGGGLNIANGFGAAMWFGARQDTRGDEPPYLRKPYDNEKICPGAHLSTTCDRALMAHARAAIWETPGQYLSFIPAKVYRLLIGSPNGHFFPMSGVISGARVLPRTEVVWAVLRIVHAVLLLVFAVLAVLWPGTLRTPANAVAFLVLGYMTALHAVSFANARYAYPLIPFMALLAAQGLSLVGMAPRSVEPLSPSIVAVRRAAVLTAVLLVLATLFGWETG